jgi:hypothetical protein
MLTIRRGAHEGFSGTYVISGTLRAPSRDNANNVGGMIYINAFERPRTVDTTRPSGFAPRKLERVTIILDGVNLSNNYGPAIYAQRAAHVDIIILDDTINTLSDWNNYRINENPDDPDEEVSGNANAAIFVTSNLTIYGRGRLTVNGLQRHGILSRDDLLIEGGNFTVNTAQGSTIGTGSNQVVHSQVGNAIHGRDSLTIKNGTFNITAGNNGLRSNNIMGSRRSPTVANKFRTTATGNSTGDSGFVSIEGGRFIQIHAPNGRAIRGSWLEGTNDQGALVAFSAGGARVMEAAVIERMNENLSRVGGED